MHVYWIGVGANPSRTSPICGADFAGLGGVTTPLSSFLGFFLCNRIALPRLIFHSVRPQPQPRVFHCVFRI